MILPKNYELLIVNWNINLGTTIIGTSRLWYYQVCSFSIYGNLIIKSSDSQIWWNHQEPFLTVPHIMVLTPGAGDLRWFTVILALFTRGTSKILDPLVICANLVRKMKVLPKTAFNFFVPQFTTPRSGSTVVQQRYPILQVRGSFEFSWESKANLELN